MAVLGLSGCASTAQMQIAATANQPITVGAGKQAAKDVVAQLFSSRGYRITKDTDFVTEFTVPSTNAWVQVLLSSNYDSEVDARISVQFVGDNPTIVSWHAFLVTNPGSAFERLTDVSRGADAPAIQTSLEQALAQLDRSTSSKPGVTPKVPVKTAAVAPAQDSGL